jgi:hypothetical protein
MSEGPFRADAWPIPRELRLIPDGAIGELRVPRLVRNRVCAYGPDVPDRLVVDAVALHRFRWSHTRRGWFEQRVGWHPHSRTLFVSRTVSVPAPRWWEGDTR